MSESPAPSNLLNPPAVSNAPEAASTPLAPHVPTTPSTQITPHDTTTHTYLNHLLTHFYPSHTTSSPHEVLIARTGTTFRAAVTTMEGNELVFRVVPQDGATRAEAMQGVIDVLEQRAEKKIARVEMLAAAREVKKRQKEAKEREEKARRTREGGVGPDVKREGGRHGDEDVAME
tara:strand:+ start:18147 stop:18671 length:525 start_codon:yes stop_codon:yes gene_type:complete